MVAGKFYNDKLFGLPQQRRYSKFRARSISALNDELHKFDTKPDTPAPSFSDKEDNNNNERASLMTKFFIGGPSNKDTIDFTKSRDHTIKSTRKIKNSNSSNRKTQRKKQRRRVIDNNNVDTNCNLEGINYYHCFTNDTVKTINKNNTKKRKKKITTLRRDEDKKKNNDKEEQRNSLKSLKNHGLVNEKISMYEKNLGIAKQHFYDKQKIEENIEKRKKTLLGVPLIGMQNFNDDGPKTFFNSPILNNNNYYNNNNNNSNEYKVNLQTMKKSSGNTILSKKSNKRRAPPVPTTNNNYNNLKKSPKLGTKFTAKNLHSSSARGNNVDHQQRKYERNFHQTYIRDNYNKIPKPVMVSLQNSSNKKRKTLYVKDANGEEAVRVLSTLCINPLARNSKRASFMMW